MLGEGPRRHVRWSRLLSADVDMGRGHSAWSPLQRRGCHVAARVVTAASTRPRAQTTSWMKLGGELAVLCLSSRWKQARASVWGSLDSFQRRSRRRGSEQRHDRGVVTRLGLRWRGRRGGDVAVLGLEGEDEAVDDVACSSVLRRLGVGAMNAGRAEVVGVSVLGCPWRPCGRRCGLVPRRVRHGGAWRRRGPGRGRGVSRPRRADDDVVGSGLCAARARSSVSLVRSDLRVRDGLHSSEEVCSLSHCGN